MKKTKILAMLLCAALAYTFVACSNSSDGSSDSGGTVSPTLPYTVLPVGTNGSAGESDNTTITYVEFGSWPQTKKTDDSITMSTTTSTVNGWTVYTGSDNKYYVLDNGNYYKVEPIKWRILTDSYDHDGNSETAGKKILLAENILINCAYYDVYDVNRTIGSATISTNNYEHSRVRAFLNGLSYQKKASDDATQEVNTEFNGKGFLQTAFTATEFAAISDTSVVNNAASTNPDGNATLWNSGNNTYASDSDTPISDKIFLLSVQEVTKSDYLFAAYNAHDSSAVTPYGTGNKRIRLTTDYAKDKGACQNTTDGYGGCWWLRSPSADYRYNARYVHDSGRANYSNGVSLADTGVVPALCLK